MYEIQQLGFQDIGCEQFEHLFMKILNYQKTRLQGKQFALYDETSLLGNYDEININKQIS